MLPWLALCAFVAVALALDLRAGADRAPSLRAALAWSVMWTSIGLAFAAVVAVADDGTAAGEYLAGFLIEKSLSLDNLFVFAVVLSFFGVPPQHRRRGLVYGVAGAVVLRAAFIVVGGAVLDTFAWFTYVLGALLALTAARIARHGGEPVDPERALTLRVLRRLMRLSAEHHGDRLIVREGGRRAATPLLAALVLITCFDVMFAIDSIPAIFAVTRDTFIVFAANAFSVLGMVSLYFLLDGLLSRFRYLHLGLAAILAYVAGRLLLDSVWHPPIALTLAVVAGCLAAAALASVIRGADRA
jgi:tellurite resistance protein TerC